MTVITFLRHATAQDRELPIADESRTLIAKGVRQMKRVAGFCDRHRLRPAYLFCSPLVRAQETAAVLQEYLPACPPANVVPWLSGGSPETMVMKLEQLTGKGLHDVWLVGHEPDFSATISLLLGSQTPRLKVKKASLIRLQVNFQARHENRLLWSVPNTLMK